MWGDGSARLRFVSEIRCSYVRQTKELSISVAIVFAPCRRTGVKPGCFVLKPLSLA